jgi:hypothetical protein
VFLEIKFDLYTKGLKHLYTSYALESRKRERHCEDSFFEGLMFKNERFKKLIL